MAFEPARNADRHPQPPPHHHVPSAPADESASGAAQEAAAPVPAEDAAIAGAPAGEERTPGATTAARWPARLAAGTVGLGRRLDAALPASAARAVAAAARVPPAAAAAGAIAAAALVLALLAGDGDGEFPGPAFEAHLLSSAPPRQAAEAPRPVASMAPAALAERLVEDPAFDLPRDAEAAAGATADASAMGAPPGRSAAEPPPPSPDDAGPHFTNGDARDPVAVLAAAVPPPADPALRVLEQLRARDSAPLAETVGSEAEADFAIQLLAAGRRELATEAWSRLQRDNADLLGGLQPTIVEPEPTVSTLFRLRAGPLATVREAQAVCASLVRRKVDCIVVGGG